ncbi:MAG TPA: hypothetical protein VHZ24_00705 [Pirellulales bacterium]|jgi:hypothetical protein|nr:hypothetical protein [Pirellulales bacterium]
MRTLRTIGWLLLAGAMLTVGSSDAKAQGYYNGWGPWWYSYVPDRIPYYVQFPPVYYSHPVPRTYGYSPYAYPAGIPTPQPDRVTVNPLLLANPHLAQPLAYADERPAPASESPPKPKVIINPFVRKQ